MPGEGSVARLADLRPELDPTHLAVSRWPVDWRPPTLPAGFCALVVDVDEVTLVCSEEQLAMYDDAPRLAVEVGWRRVTFAGPLPWEQVGFLADVAGPAGRRPDPVHQPVRVHHGPRPGPGGAGRPRRRRSRRRRATRAAAGHDEPVKELPTLAVLAVVGAGLASARRTRPVGGWGRGSSSASDCCSPPASGCRCVSGEAGFLVVRSRGFDAAVLLVLGFAVVALANTIPNGGG